MKTLYSEEIAGNKSNYNLEATFDKTDGVIGITQPRRHCDDEAGIDRVFLSSYQVKELFRFVYPRLTKSISF